MESVHTNELEALGAKTAKTLVVTGKRPGRRAAAALRRELRAFFAVCRGPDAGEWYADNEYLARREAANALRALENAGPLRVCGGEPAMLRLCRAFAEAGPVTETRAQAFLTGARGAAPLPDREARLFGTFVFWALLRALTTAASEPAAPEPAAPEPAAPEREAAALFTSLRTLSELSLAQALELSDPLDAVLRRDADYPLMDEATRALYRARCRELAEKRGQDAAALAAAAVKSGLGEALFPFREKRGVGYIAASVLVPLALSAAAGFQTHSALTGLLLLAPASELVRTALTSLLLHFVPPAPPPRMELKNGLPQTARTVCAVSCLLADDDTGPRLARRLEEYRLASRDCGENLLFALLADAPESKSFPCPGFSERLEAAAALFRALNEKYGGGFYLLTRDPVWSAAEGVWMPWERKRGAILELARLTQGRKSVLRAAAGDPKALRARYILALDADTRLLPGAARRLLGAACHPLCRPFVKNGVVVRGHGALHPRMATELPNALSTDFARIYAGQGGTDPYGAPTGELFSDLFGRGGFAGKGVLDAACYLDCLDGVLPEGRILSHDTPEGAFLRGGFAGDVLLTDTAPVTAAGWFRRLHRWTRGDWQNLAFLFRRGKRLAPIDRWRIFESLRRSLVPPSALAAVILGLCKPEYRPLALLAVGCLAADALHAALSGLFARRADLRQRCRSGVLRGLGGSLTRLLARLIFLPWEAWCCFSAMAASLWRMAVTKKHLLRWVTAAQSDGRPGGPEFAWFSMALGAALLVFAPTVLGKAQGLVWLLNPLLALAASAPNPPKNELTDRDKDFLKESAAAIWQYFAQECRESEHFLPPDNVQEQPPRGAAHRTSPTNIGLALTAALSAADLGLAPPEEAFGLVENIMSTLEALPKWNGHLYNWVDTRRAAPLVPAYVSTVDSGNLCACLVCLKNGLLEHGRPALARRAAALAAGMRFEPLYDEKKKLFYIGLDAASGKPSPGHYDLLASEARLTSFLAAARGDVPAAHWRALSRAQLSLDGWRGLASWSGSVFEYLMPELFLPLVPGSLLWETGRFCLYAQRRRGGFAKTPWGFSESAFYSLDAGMDYRYKAHGAAALALRRGMDAELVVSPYSSFLALAVHPKAAVKNLRRLRSAGLWGRYGFYEALDYTPGRSPARGKRLAGAAVECFMSHHLGMSMAAAANCLLGGALRKRFMAEPENAAFAPLLAERVPLGGPVLHKSRSPAGHTPPPRPEEPALALGSDAPALTEGAWFPLSNGVYSLLAGENGVCRAAAGGLLLYRPDTLALFCGDTPLTPSLARREARPWRFERGALAFTTRRDDVVMLTSLCAAARGCAELRRVSAIPGGALRLQLEPVLAKPRDHQAHPAFWRLGLEVRAQNGAVIVRRLRRGELPECYLCAAATVPLRVEQGAGWQLTGPVTLTARLPDSGFTSLALCFAYTRQEALDGARRVLEGGGADMLSSMGRLLGLGAEGQRAALRLCAALAEPRVSSGDGGGREGLWAAGISGDLPVVYGDAREGVEEAMRLVKRHALLTACGLSSDLVLDTGEGGDYLQPRAAKLRAFLERYGLTAFVNAPGGVHFAGGTAVAAAAVLPPRAREEGQALQSPPPIPARSGLFPKYRWLSSGAFCFDTPPLPPRAWSNILTNGSFGFLAADAGVGNMWLENAREYPVSPWDNEPLSVRGREMLELVTDGGRHSLFAGGDGSCRVSFGFGWARWERAGMALTAFVPRKHRARLFLIEGGEGARVSWHTALSLCADPADAVFAVTGFEDGCLTARNPRAAWPAVFRAAATEPFEAFTGDESAWLRGRMDGQTGGGLRPCLAAQWRAGSVSVLACGFESAETLKALAQPERAARELMAVRDSWRSLLGRFRQKTPEEELDRMMNGWALYQTVACRVLGRMSLYQNGGAYGFRDQLQDTVNLLLVAPGAARRHILKSCERQFEQGDVLHFWHEHPDGPRGVRTRCSDDLAWLAWALCEYTEKTGDTALCRETARWLHAEPLGENERDRYFAPPLTERADTVLEHARRALTLALERERGPHGLPLMGSGDWNDGMDAFGGESVWLCWFLAHIAGRFAALLDALGEPDADRFRREAEDLTATAQTAWDGRWYLRGYWPDGTKLGGAGASENALDSVAQSWAAFCPGADGARVDMALRECYGNLFDEAHGVVKLFWPPFTDGGRDPGYIRACGPGYRENGGQYTHGALWLASALLKRGMTQEGSKLLLSLLPARHPAAVWQAEPFVLAADVSAGEDHYGTALWSWYTGSAGWFFRVVTEDLLGLRLKNGALTASGTALPAGWEGFEARVCGRLVRVRDGRAVIED